MLVDEKRPMHQHKITPDMLSVEEARDKILALVSVLNSEDVPLLEAMGQVLAEDVLATFDIPQWNNSAMDGYALRHADVRGARTDNTVTLKVIGQVSAGQVSKLQVQPGTAIRIMTGAPIPIGADTVVPFEETDESERTSVSNTVSHIGIQAEPPRGGSVRPSGEDARMGETVLAEGSVLRSSELGVLASLGYSNARVIRRPVVAIVSTGDELVSPGAKLEDGKIYDSNSYTIASLVKRYGGVPKIIGIASDNLDSMNDMLNQSLIADLLITSAGVSKGDYDIVKDVLAERGEIAFWSVRMRPAKPLAFGMLRGPKDRSIPHLGLPGNPVSAMVAFEELGRPALLKMLGYSNLEKPTVKAVLEDSIINFDSRRVYARAIVTRRGDTYFARTTGPQGSNILTSMAKANGLAICPENLPGLGPGETVEVQMLDWDQGGVL